MKKSPHGIPQGPHAQLLLLNHVITNFDTDLNGPNTSTHDTAFSSPSLLT